MCGIRAVGPHRAVGSVLTMLLLSSLASCRDDRFKKTYPVTGQVLFEGKPPVGARVLFHSLEDPNDEISRPRATVDAEGRFVVNTYVPKDGAPAGNYVVTLHWLPKGFNGPVEAGNKLPMRYAKAETSGFKVEIRKENNDLEPFLLHK
jgi:hypothetical protein